MNRMARSAAFGELAAFAIVHLSAICWRARYKDAKPKVELIDPASATVAVAALHVLPVAQACARFHIDSAESLYKFALNSLQKHYFNMGASINLQKGTTRRSIDASHHVGPVHSAQA